MDFTHFIFAFYVFLLACGAIWFFGRVTRSGEKKDRSSYEREHRLFVMYQNVEDMLDSFEEYAEKAKTGIDERLSQMESLIENLRQEWESRMAPQVREEPKDSPQREEKREEAAPAPLADTQVALPAAEQIEPQSMPKPAIEPVSQADSKPPQKESKSPADKPKLKTPDLIQQYAEQGMSKEEIAKALGISMREVTLIMEIKKIHV